MEQKIVVHLKDGTIRKGITHEFDPKAETFYYLPGEGGGVPIRVRLDAMKALFWVKDFFGNREFVARRRFDESQPVSRRAIVTFRDGEQIWGTVDEDVDEPTVGFFFYPSDKEDNNIRIFVIRSAIEELRLMP